MLSTPHRNPASAMPKRPLAMLFAFLIGAVAVGCEDVSVTQLGVATLEVNPAAASIQPNQTMQLSATAFAPSGTPLPGRTAEWTALDPEVATVSESGLVRGVATGSARIRATIEGRSATASIQVGSLPRVGLSRSGVQFSATVGGSATAPVTVAVTNGGGGSLAGLGTSIAWVEGAAGWLEATLSGTSAPTTLTLRAAPGSLPPGRYEADVRVTSSGSGATPATLTVVFQIGEPAPSIGVAPGALGFASSEGQSPPLSQTVRITNLGGGAVAGLNASISYASGGATGWLTATLAGSSAPTDLVLRVNPQGLSTGVHDAEVRLTASGSGQGAVVQVRYRYGDAPPQFAVSAGLVSRTVEEGTSPTAPDTLRITNAGTGTLDGITLSVDDSGSVRGWVDARLSSTAAPALLIVTMDPEGLAPGSYEARVRLASSAAINSPTTVLLRLRVEARAPHPSAATSTLDASPREVTPGEPSTVSVQLRDAAGNALATGGDGVFLTTSLGSLSRTSGTTDDSGRFLATLTSTLPGTAVVSAYLGSSASDPLIGSTTVTIRPVADRQPDAGQSTLEADPTRFTTDAYSDIEIQLRDADGDDFEVEGVAVFLVTTLGALDLAAGTSDDDGEFATRLRSSTVGTGTVTAYLGTDADGPRIGSVDIRVDPGDVSVSGSSITATPTDISAGETSTIVVQLRDAAGNAVREEGEDIFLRASGGRLSSGTGMTDRDGRFVVMLRVNPSDVGTITITAWLDDDDDDDDNRIDSVQVRVTR